MLAHFDGVNALNARMLSALQIGLFMFFVFVEHNLIDHGRVCF